MSRLYLPITEAVQTVWQDVSTDESQVPNIWTGLEMDQKDCASGILEKKTEAQGIIRTLA